jgi:hypothetical protein
LADTEELLARFRERVQARRALVSAMTATELAQFTRMTLAARMRIEDDYIRDRDEAEAYAAIGGRDNARQVIAEIEREGFRQLDLDEYLKSGDFARTKK